MLQIFVEEMDRLLLTLLTVTALCCSETRGVITSDFNLIKAPAAGMRLCQVINLLKMFLKAQLWTVMISCNCCL